MSWKWNPWKCVCVGSLRLSQAWCAGATFLYYKPRPVVCQFASPGGGHYTTVGHLCSHVEMLVPSPVCEMAGRVVGVHLIL